MHLGELLQEFVAELDRAMREDSDIGECHWQEFSLANIRLRPISEFSMKTISGSC